MSIGIIIRPSGYSRKSGAPTFRPHFNREICDKQNPHGTMMYTKEQYYGTLKARGLQPYDPSAQDSAKTKPVKLTDDTKKVLKSIDEQTYDGKFKPSGRLLDKMKSKGVNLRPNDSDLKKLPACYQKGGISADKK